MHPRSPSQVRQGDGPPAPVSLPPTPSCAKYLSHGCSAMKSPQASVARNRQHAHCTPAPWVGYGAGLQAAGGGIGSLRASFTPGPRWKGRRLPGVADGHITCGRSALAGQSNHVATSRGMRSPCLRGDRTTSHHKSCGCKISLRRGTKNGKQHREPTATEGGFLKATWTAASSLLKHHRQLPVASGTVSNLLSGGGPSIGPACVFIPVSPVLRSLLRCIKCDLGSPWLARAGGSFWKIL